MSTNVHSDPDAEEAPRSDLSTEVWPEGVLPQPSSYRPSAGAERLRLTQLHALSAALTGATTVEQAAEAILATGCGALGANAGSVALLSPEGQEFLSIRCIGYPRDIIEKFQRYSTQSGLPIADAALVGSPIFIETLEERNRRYPFLANNVIPGGRGAMAALPLIAHGRVQGGVTLNFATDRTFDEPERAFMGIVTHLCALAIDRVHSMQAERESEERFAVLFNHSQDAIGVAANGKIRYVNAAYAAMLGYESPSELVGLSAWDVVVPADRPRLMEIARQRMDGETNPQVYVFRALRKDGTEIAVENRVSFVQQAGEKLTLVIARDVTARNKRIRSQRFLIDASAVLSSSLDYETTLRNVAELAVPHLGDWCVIHLANDDGILIQVAATHVDPTKAAMAQDVARRYPPDPNRSTGLYAVLRSGKTEVVNNIPEEALRAAAVDEEHLRILIASGMRSYMCVALPARDRLLGAITLLGAESGHHYGLEDVALAEELARRAGLAVENARLFRSEQEARLAEQQAREEVEALNGRLRQAMTETHHRIKNNLQMISAMIDMRLDEYTPDVSKQEFERLNAHVLTLASLHDLLTQQAKEDAAANSVSIQQVLAKVVELTQAAASERKIHLKADDRPIAVRQATGLSLVLAELLANSIKYAAGPITVQFAAGDRATLEVLDEGPGFPGGSLPDPAKSTGMELVETIVRWDLSGDITLGNRPEGGARVVVSFPWQAYDIVRSYSS